MLYQLGGGMSPRRNERFPDPRNSHDWLGCAKSRRTRTRRTPRHHHHALPSGKSHCQCPDELSLPFTNQAHIGDSVQKGKHCIPFDFPIDDQCITATAGFPPIAAFIVFHYEYTSTGCPTANQDLLHAQTQAIANNSAILSGLPGPTHHQPLMEMFRINQHAAFHAVTAFAESMAKMERRMEHLGAAFGRASSSNATSCVRRSRRSR